jgi:hypothetical protein
MLIPAVVAAAAASEIRTGERVSLDWPLDHPSHPSFGRALFESRLVNRTKPGGAKRCVNDDILHFNTQFSSQWDGFRHYGGCSSNYDISRASSLTLSDELSEGVEVLQQHFARRLG